MQKTLRTEIVPVSLIILSFILSIFFYQHFPGRVPIHWNLAGQPNGYGTAFFAAFFFPVLILGLYLLFLIIPYIDPRKERYAEFAKIYHIFKSLVIALMVAIYIVASMSGMGIAVPVAMVIPILIGILFIAIGNYFGKIRSNFMMGIRTPWTLSNEDVWNRTHRFGGKLFIVGGIIMILSSVVPVILRFPLIIIVVICVAILVFNL